MGIKDDDFEKKLLATFRIEAEEHIRGISSHLVDLEKSSTEAERAGTVETIFREAHSLKGAARAVNATEIENLCQSLESVFAAMKRGSIAYSPALFDLLHSSADAIATVISSPELKTAGSSAQGTVELTRALEKVLKGAVLPNPGVLARLREAPAAIAPVPQEIKKEPDAAVPSPTPPDHSTPDTVRVSVAKLNSLLLQVEELRAPKLGLSQHLADLRDLVIALSAWEQKRTVIQAELQRLRDTLDARDGGNSAATADLRQKAKSQLAQLSSLLERNDGLGESLSIRFGTLFRLADQDHRTLSSMISSLLEDTRRLSLVPFSSLFEGFPKLVRDVSREHGKDVALDIAGSEIETDRRILEELKDPLIHLLRNCIDHGIESPDERERKGKPRRGTITISITPKGGDKVEMLIADDGAGINLSRVRAAAAAAGTGSKEKIASLADADALPLIFQSGVSTSPIITNLSGRGLGLAIAREKVEKLGGTLTVESRTSAGTDFRISLPLTLATFRGILVRASDRTFVIPTSYVERVLRVDPTEIKTMGNRETIRHAGEAVSLVRLRHVFDLPQAKSNASPEKLHVLVLRAAGDRIAFLVDEILNEQEVMVKPLGQQLARVRNLAGATILGTGKIVPIVNVHDLMKSATKFGSAREESSEDASQAARRSVLIAEDSITSRTLLKNIVESAGYDVRTAVDGLEAFTSLKEGSFDLVVSDVEMPRMTGFDLTAKIRADKKLSEIPVILVTALSTPEDRERGIDVGANAYIVKSSFDHSDLLQTIQRLI